MSFLESINWRYATKKFDTNKNLTESILQKIREAIQMAPTAFGVQMFSVIEAIDSDTREKMKQASFNQPQVSDADRIFVFCARSDGENRIEKMFTEMSGGDSEVRKGALAGYEAMVRGAVLSKNKEQMLAWSQKNAGIALGFALAACAELKVDACPMDGFDPLAIKNILNLSDDFIPVAYLAVGYRDNSDETIKRPKFRFSEKEIFTRI